jgi:hypothetical protein
MELVLLRNTTEMKGVKQMPKVKNVEKKIWEIEGFDVAFKQANKNTHGNKTGVPQYGYSKAVKNDMTVAEWKEKRFGKNYPGFDVDIFDGDGDVVTGQTKIGTLRDTYQEDE